ncbi:hypothetical protein BFL43_04970 [Williamsia sp. 1135]|jgi:bifunctional non-homologous end joining protein LigD|nr:hypothetical protein BFL43_04970 [Williamsia sp. 1135]
MLATLGEPPQGGSQGLAVEFKWDGVRCIAENRSETTRLFSRNSNNFSSSYPELVAAIPDILDGRSAVLDGEIVALDPKGRPSFSRLQRRMHVQKPTGQLVAATPAQFYVFDILELDGQDTTRLPYLERREILDELALSGKSVQTPPFWTNVDIQAMLDTAKEHGLEGIVTKRVTSTYQPGRRSPAWRVNCTRRAVTG